MCFFFLLLAAGKQQARGSLTGAEDAGEVESSYRKYIYRAAHPAAKRCFWCGITPCALLHHLSHYIPKERVTSFVTKPLKKYNKKKVKKIIKKVCCWESLEFLELCLTCGSQPGGCGGSAPRAAPGNSPGCWETASPKWGETSPNWQPPASKWGSVVEASRADAVISFSEVK